MTTAIVQSINDEDLAELEEICRQQAFECCGNYSVGGEYMGQWERVCCGEPRSTERDITWPAEEVLNLIARLRAAEADAKRYHWLIDNWRVQEVIDVVLDDNSDTVDAYGPLIDAAMERKP
jgi:hypothetical protein